MSRPEFCDRLRTRPFVALVFLAATALFGAVAVAEPAATVRNADLADPIGWRLSIGPQKGAAVDERLARQVALAVRAGESASPFLAPGPFRAEWKGLLQLDRRERAYFQFEGRGQAQLFIDGESVLEASGDDLSQTRSRRQRLEQGKRTVHVVYTAPAAGDARLRLMWKGRDFAWEALSPERVSPGPASELGAKAAQHRAARTLYAETRCHRCHNPELKDAGGMPELNQDAPSFAGVGSRLRAGYLLEWILNPRAVRPTARMPALFAHRTIDAMQAANDSAANDIVAWLMTQGAEAAKESEPEASLEHGAGLFHELGCIACHHRPDAKSVPADTDRIPLGHVAAKFRPQALRAFLADPDRHHQTTRMPDFGLTASEAVNLAAWMRAVAAAPTVAQAAEVAGDVARGEQLVQSMGCLDCHEAKVHERQGRPRGLSAQSKVERGCLAEDAEARGRGADFGFDVRERQLLRDLVRGALPSLERRIPGEDARRQVEDLRCQACHAADGESSYWDRFAGETSDLEVHHGEEKLSQIRPQLTWVGEKLHTGWISRVVAGDPKTRMRPWLGARMPAWKSRADELAQGLVRSHGLWPADPDARPLDPEMVEHGKWLIGREGFGCGACHQLGPTPAYARFEFGANDLAATPERLRFEFFRRWMWDPRRVDAANRMPLYADEEGYTQHDEILDGEADPQFAAMWQYLRTLSKD